MNEITTRDYYQRNKEDLRLRASVNYHKRMEENHEAMLRTQQQWRNKNRVKYNDYLKEWRKKNKDRLKNQRLKRYTDGSGSVISKWKAYCKKRKQIDPAFALKQAVGCNLRRHLKRAHLGKTKKTISYLGCNIRDLQLHLEKQFSPEMNWSNRGQVWDIDHIIPFSYFTDNQLPVETGQHYCNLQPLDSHVNRHIKKDSIMQPYLHKILAHPDAPDELVDIALALLSY